MMMWYFTYVRISTPPLMVCSRALRKPFAPALCVTKTSGSDMYVPTSIYCSLLVFIKTTTSNHDHFGVVLTSAHVASALHVTSGGGRVGQ